MSQHRLTLQTHSRQGFTSLLVLSYVAPSVFADLVPETLFADMLHERLLRYIAVNALWCSPCPRDVLTCRARLGLLCCLQGKPQPS